MKSEDESLTKEKAVEKSLETDNTNHVLKEGYPEDTIDTYLADEILRKRRIEEIKEGTESTIDSKLSQDEEKEIKTNDSKNYGVQKNYLKNNFEPKFLEKVYKGAKSSDLSSDVLKYLGPDEIIGLYSQIYASRIWANIDPNHRIEENDKNLNDIIVSGVKERNKSLREDRDEEKEYRFTSSARKRMVGKETPKLIERINAMPDEGKNVLFESMQEPLDEHNNYVHGRNNKGDLDKTSAEIYAKQTYHIIKNIYES